MNSGPPPDEDEDKAMIEKYSERWKKEFTISEEDVMEMRAGAIHYGMQDAIRNYNENARLPCKICKVLYAPYRRISKDQKTYTRKGTGIPTSWITKFEVPEYCYDKWYHKITGFVYGSRGEESINNCVDALVDNINRGIIEFDEHKLKLIFDNVQEKLWIKLQEGREKQSQESLDMERAAGLLLKIGTGADFIRQWRDSMYKDCKKYVARINDQGLVEALSKYLDEQSIDPLHRIIIRKGKTDYFKENEGVKLEYKESIFVNKIKLKKEFSNLQKASRVDPKMKFETYQSNKNDKLILEIAQTVCAFLNTKGGNLWIGITDKRKVVGIEIEKSNSHFKSRMPFEKFKERYLDYISEKLDFHFSDFAFFYGYTDPYIPTKDKSKTLFLIKVREANKPAFVIVKDGKKEKKIPYLRRGSGDFSYDGSDPKRTLSEFYEFWNSKNS